MAISTSEDSLEQPDSEAGIAAAGDDIPGDRGGAAAPSSVFAPMDDPVRGQAIDPQNLDIVMDIPLEVTVELGRKRMSIRDILDLGSGSVVELDKIAGEPVDLLVNGRLVARGEVVVIEDNFGVRITEITGTPQGATPAATE